MTVLINIVNSQLADGEIQEITDSVKGELVCDGNGFTLVYDDRKLGGQTSVTVSGGDLVSVCRVDSGFNTEMIFEKDKLREVVYTPPYGEIMLETRTQSISSFVEENSGFIEYEYDLLSGGEKQSHNRMKISFSEEKDV